MQATPAICNGPQIIIWSNYPRIISIRLCRELQQWLSQLPLNFFFYYECICSETLHILIQIQILNSLMTYYFLFHCLLSVNRFTITTDLRPLPFPVLQQTNRRLRSYWNSTVKLISVFFVLFQLWLFLLQWNNACYETSWKSRQRALQKFFVQVQ